MAAAGIREDQIVQVITNPETGKPIAAKTLRKHFREELDTGHTKADTKVALGLYKNATTATPTYPGGIPVAQIFWLKTRGRWKPPDPAAPPEKPISPEQMDERETARRMAFLLARGAAAQEKPASSAPPAPKKKAKEPA